MANEIEAYKREYFYAGTLNDIDASGNVFAIKSSSEINAAFVLRRGYTEIIKTSSTTVALPRALRAQAAANNYTEMVNARKNCSNCDFRSAQHMVYYNGWQIDLLGETLKNMLL